MGISSRELIERMRSGMPLFVTLPDPVTGEPFTINRENILALLVIDMDHLVLESQMVAMLYGEMSRVHRAAELAKESADAQFRSWKAQKSAEARKKLDGGEYAASTKKKDDDGKASPAKKKPPTDKQVEEFYRTHPEYEGEYQKANKAKALVGLALDLKEAFRLKQAALKDLHSVMHGHNNIAAGEDRLEEMAMRVMTPEAQKMMQAAAQTAADLIKGGGKRPRKPERKD